MKNVSGFKRGSIKRGGLTGDVTVEKGRISCLTIYVTGGRMNLEENSYLVRIHCYE